MVIEEIKKRYKYIALFGLISFIWFILVTDFSNQVNIGLNLVISVILWIAASLGFISGQNETEKDWGKAVIASFIIPGLGQVYCGKMFRGLSVFVVVVITLILMRFSDSLNNIPGIVFIAIWLWNIYDAYKLANETTP